ncbi:hypothetical protein BX600DRAFT_62810 [Xylariales sp. PMI_506]|nr:hypothetical protein BX600DRAFT_62810 [Xylariales sp. PMI_506]
MMAQHVVPIRRCPERLPVETVEHWYRLSSAPSLGICSRCYQDHLSATPFAQNFEHEYDPSGTKRCCDFSTPRMMLVLHQALQQNDFKPLQEYMMYRNTIPRCKGGGGVVEATEGYLWYQLSDPPYKGKFGLCKSCYEDYIVPAGFTQHFLPPIQQPGGSKFECDLGWPFCKRLAKSCKDWNQIPQYGIHRKWLPRCTGLAEAEAGSRTWYKLRPSDLDSLWLCEACYYDAASMTHMEEHIYNPPQQPAPQAKLRCFLNGSVALRVAWDEALLQTGDFNTFYRAAQIFVRSPPCAKEGTQNATWYSVNPPCDFDVCGACYAGILESTGFGHFLTQKWVQPGEAKLCDLNPGAPRAHSYYIKLDQALDTGDARIFTDYVRGIADLPACPGGTPVTSRRWYRHDVFTACQACWFEAVRGTPLDQVAFTIRDELYEPTLRCDFYSARVRRLWRDACARNDLPTFVALMRQRLDIWSQTYPQIQMQLAQMRMNAQRQQTLLMSSVMLTGAGGIAAAASGHSSGNFGNSQIGYGYSNYASAQGAAQFQQAVGMNTANGPAQMSILQLEALWKSVE